MSSPHAVHDLDEYLQNEVDYSWKKYIPSEDALLFVNFIKEVNGGSEEEESPLAHMELADVIFSKRRRSAVLAHRGFAKSSFIEYLVLFVGAFGYIPNFGKTNLMLYVSDSIENGVKNFRRNVQFRYENSEYLQKLIPNVKIKATSSESSISGSFKDGNKAIDRATNIGTRFTDVRLEFVNYKGHNTIVKLYGAKTGIKGTKELGTRPQVAFLDDLIQGDKMARSKTMMDDIKNTIYKDVAKALNPKRQKIVYVGTPYNKSDPLVEAVESGAWDVRVFPICEKFPCTREEFRGSWEERFSYDYVKQEYEEAIAVGRPDAFWQELMLRISSEDDKLVKESEILWYRSSDDIVLSKQNYNFFITTDFSVTGKDGSDPSAISVWAYDDNGVIYWVNGMNQRCTIDIGMNRTFQFAKFFNPFQVGIERSGQQYAIVTMFEQAMIRLKQFFVLAREKGAKDAGLNSTVDKIQRFNTVLPFFRLGIIKFPENKKTDPVVVEMIHQIRSVTADSIKSKHDDLLDTVFQLSKMTLIKPSVQRPKKIKHKKVKSKLESMFDDTVEIKSTSTLESYLN